MDITKKGNGKFLMEDNSLTPSPMPTPDPGTSMPEFAAAPTANQQPVIPPASAMPDFGNQQHTQPMPMPMPPVPMPTQPEPQPAAQPVAQPTPEQTAPAAPAEQPTAPTESQFGEIMDAGTPDTAAPAEPAAAPVDASAPAEPAMPNSENVPSAFNLNPTPAETPAPAVEKKKVNTKLIILIGAAALLIVGCIVAAILLLSQPKPTSSPNTNPTPAAEVPTIDTSVAFDKLTNEQALEFLNALEGDATYFPTDYTDEETYELIADKNIAMFYSYEKTSDILNIVKESDFAAKFKDKVTKDTATITEKTDYAIVDLDSEATGCGSSCTGIIFDKKVVNFYSEPYTDVLTGVKSQIVHIMLINHTKADVEKVAPLIASVFMNKQKIYSTELKEENGEFEFIVNTLEFKDSKKETAKATKTHFKVIATGEFLYMPNLTESSELK